MTTILIVILILLLVGALPNVGLATNYGPSGLIGLLLVILLVLIILGKI